MLWNYLNAREPRCWEDQVNFKDVALKRVDWGIKCGGIPAGKRNLFTEETDPVTNKTRQLERPYYPHWESENQETGEVTVFIPKLEQNSSGEFLDCKVPNGFYMTLPCQMGCYSGEQEILFGSGYKPIEQASRELASDIITLAPDATMENLRFVTNQVQSYTVDTDAHDQELLKFETTQGGTLRVTSEHPIVLADGTIRQASDVKIGDMLVRADGALDDVVRVTTENYSGRVFNVKPVTTDLRTNVIVAQGFLNGSVRYQNSYRDYLGRVLLRDTLNWTTVNR